MSTPYPEEWRAIPGYPLYEVSNCGRVRSQSCVVTYIRNGSEVHMTKRGQLLKQSLNDAGRPVVVVRNSKGSKTKQVSRLVARTFIGKPPKGKPYALHGDDDPTNNSVGNLRWGSPQDNMDDKVNRERSARGVKNGRAVIDERMAIRIAGFIRKGFKSPAISEQLNVARHIITRIGRGESWAHVTGL